jgi:hypothetical protein
MMEDFHDSAQRAGGAFDVAASVEAEARATGRGGARRVRRLHRHRPERGPTRRARRLHRQPPGGDMLGSVTPHAATGGGLSRLAHVPP